MLYRTLKNERDISALGFGCMRLPTIKANGKDVIDRDKAIPMIRSAIDAGVNYIDTAYGYHDGESEVVVGEALRDGYRDKVVLATKLPPWVMNVEADLRKVFDTQLKRLQTDHVDVYLMHALDKGNFEKLKRLNAFAFMDALKASGEVKHPGFSFHDDYPVFKEIVDHYDGFGIAQLQLNIIDRDTQATLEGMRYAAAKGLSVIIMEPLRGGQLANVTDDVRAIYNAFDPHRTPVDWALRYMLNFPEVLTVLSGMGAQEQVEENMRVASEALPGGMSDGELAIIDAVKAHYEGKIRVPCTACEYCMPCPFGVAIPNCFSIYNESAMSDNWERGKRAYSRDLSGKDASMCAECGACMEKCPQHIDIIGQLKEVAGALG